MQLIAEGNNATYSLIYMIMRCSCYAYACMQVIGAPSASFIYLLLRVCAWLCTKGYMQHRPRLVQKGDCRAGPDSRALWVELTEMLNVP